MSTSLLRATEVQQALREHATLERQVGATRFFKTGPGEYGEGDVFLGVSVPDARRVAKRAEAMPDEELLQLLCSPIHEERFTALAIWVAQFARGTKARRERIYTQYLSQTRHINNWDLVDCSAYFIVGAWLLERDRGRLQELRRSSNMWERRISVVSTLAFIRAGDLSETFEASRALLRDPHDLMHKACGWMLREAGKRDVEALRSFLSEHAHAMPRTMLRYAIERLDADERALWRLK